MSAKGRRKCTYIQMPSLLEQMYIGAFDERSEHGKSQIFRVSVLHSIFKMGTRNAKHFRGLHAKLRNEGRGTTYGKR